MQEIDDFLNNIVAENGIHLAFLIQFARSEFVHFQEAS